MYFASILFHDVRKIESGARFMYDTLGPLLVRSFAHDSDARGPSRVQSAPRRRIPEGGAIL
jgi:hypothetical protein